jgi:hypothetical protein
MGRSAARPKCPRAASRYSDTRLRAPSRAGAPVLRVKASRCALSASAGTRAASSARLRRVRAGSIWARAGLARCTGPAARARAGASGAPSEGPWGVATRGSGPIARGAASTGDEGAAGAGLRGGVPGSRVIRGVSVRDTPLLRTLSYVEPDAAPAP